MFPGTDCEEQIYSCVPPPLTSGVISAAKQNELGITLGYKKSRLVLTVVCHSVTSTLSLDFMSLFTLIFVM